MNIQVLSAGRENEILNLRNRFLIGHGYHVTPASSIARAINCMFEGEFDVILLCNSLTVEDRRMLTAVAARYCPWVPVVVISDTFNRQQQGQEEYISSGNINEIMGVLDRAVMGKASARLRRAHQNDKAPLPQAQM